jgi:hypothetical protein
MSNPLQEFTRSLWAGGELVLSQNTAPDANDIALGVSELRQLEIEYRLGLPGQPPGFDPQAAEWALTSLYRACQFLVYRELPEELLRSDLSRKYPADLSPAVCYSVDLSFRFLPDILRMARAASAHDPLVECLRNWAKDWPLSSVGIVDVEPGSVAGFLDDLSLRTIYIDRILATQDRTRLTDERVAAAVRIALGGFRELSPAIYDAVQQK